MFETKSLSFKIADDGSLGRFSGDASTYGNVDLAGDIVLPGAFKRCLAEKGIHYPLLWSHDMKDVIGSFDVVDSEAALRIEGSFNMDVQRGKEGYHLLKRGDLRGLSIGYIVKDCDWDAEGHRLLKEVELVEVSLVAFPCNPEATAEAKNMKKLELKEGLSSLDEETRAAFISMVKEALSEIEKEDGEDGEDPSEDGDEGEDAPEENNDEDEAKAISDIVAEVKSLHKELIHHE